MASCVGVTVAILLVFLVASYSVDSALFTAPDSPSVQIEVTGHQWWWEIRYQDPVPSRIFTTANEIHLPVGETVRLTLRSPDVIHSFWVPNLAGKRDLIPGQTNYIWITAERPGTYRGQCAEFCGLQHAHMALYVTVEDRPAFERWQEQQRQPAPSPSDPRSAARPRGLPVRSVRHVPHDPRDHRGRHDRPRSDACREPALDRQRGACRTRAATAPAGSPIRRPRSPATRCRWCRFRPRISGRCSSYLDTLE